nr:immunoglobulin heavy chain junction region [Macaca mulatta]MOV40888.1 immunoglobulin heavy chain junction region [Macaca mulatta]MOV41149.1 immunoglobulin heavy chain junction region [Macaca mulatta]MOV45778.1 immunoglobulin heavy chain junction region [Macaca mulatta]
CAAIFGLLRVDYW